MSDSRNNIEHLECFERSNKKLSHRRERSQSKVKLKQTEFYLEEFEDVASEREGVSNVD